MLRLLKDGHEVTETVTLRGPNKLIPFHIKGKPPSYFIVAGLVFTPATVPYLRSEYGKEYDFDAPVSKWEVLLCPSLFVASQSCTQTVLLAGS